MAEFNVPETKRAKAGEILSWGNWHNMVIGINRSKDGAKQAVSEFQEFLGLVPEGTTEYKTQQMLKEQEILRDANSNDEDLTWAPGAEFAGELLPSMLVPVGGSAKAGAALGAVAGGGFFHDDPKETSRLVDMAFGAGFGSAAGKVSGALRNRKPKPPAAQAAEKTIRDMMGPPEGNKAWVRGLNAADFQNAGRAPDYGRPSSPFPRGPTGMAPVPSGGPLAPLAGRSAGDAAQGTGMTSGPLRGTLMPREGAPALGAQRALPPGSIEGRVVPEMRGLPGQRALSAPAPKRLPAPPQRLLKGPSTDLVKKAIDKVDNIVRTTAKQVMELQAALSKRNLSAAAKAAVEKKLARAQTEANSAEMLSKVLKDQAPKAEAMGQATAAQRKIFEYNTPVKGSDGKDLFPLYGAGQYKSAASLEKQGLGTIVSSQKHNNHRANRFFKWNEGAGIDYRNGALRKGSKEAGFIFSQDPLNAVAGGVAGAAAVGGATDSPEGAALGALGGAIGGVAFGRALDRRMSNKQRAQMREVSKAGGEYNEQVSRAVKAKDITMEGLGNFASNARKILDSVAGATMTRLEVIAPRVATALKNTEFMQHHQSGIWLNEGGQLLNRIDAAGLTDGQARQLKISMLNSTANAQKYLRSLGKTDAADALAEMDTLLARVGTYLGEVGLGKGLRANYFPRMVKDTEYFENIQEVSNYLEMVAKKKGVPLNDFEKEVAITDAINGALQKQQSGNFAKASANLKRRTNKVTQENVDAYADPRESMYDYFESVTNQVERRKFFQGQGIDVEDIGTAAENMDSIAKKMAQALKKGDMTVEQANEAAELIRMRFGPGEQAPHKAIQNFKNLTYTGLLGNPMSALTQLGDLAFSAHKNGLQNTVKAALDELAGRGKIMGLDKRTLLGIQDATTEFVSKTGTKDVLDWALKHSGFQAMDRFGKNTFIQSAMMKNKQLPKEDFISKWSSRFDPDAPPGTSPRTEKLYEQVQSFQKIDDNNRGDIGFMLWNELQDVQPIALSALPEQYLKTPNLRVAYMLKSFTLKVFDVMRKDIGQNIAKKNYKQAAKEATSLASYWMMMNGTTDGFKNFLTGKDQSGLDVVVNNTFKLFGMNKYMMTQAQREGLGSAALKAVTPPTALIDALGDSKKAVSMIPLVGRNAAEYME